ncbi:MAG TPA: phosphotransferase [Ktedonobacterales bacterium]
MSAKPPLEPTTPLQCPYCSRELDEVVVSAAGELLGCVDCVTQRGLAGRVLTRAEWLDEAGVRGALERYGLTEYVAAKPPQSAVRQPRAHEWVIRTEGGRFALKRFPAEMPRESVHYQHGVLDHLIRQRLPVAQPVHASDGTSYVEVDGVVWALYRGLDGAHVGNQDWMWRVPRVAETMALMHNTLAGFAPEGRPHPEWAEWNAARVDGMLALWPPLEELPPELLEDVRERLVRRYLVARAELPRTIVHGDLGSANVLWTGDAVTGILDLDRAHEDTALFDFGAGVGTRWPPLLRAAVATYTRLRPLSSLEREVLPEALLLGAVIALHHQVVVTRNIEETSRKAQELYLLVRDAESLRRAVAAQR